MLFGSAGVMVKAFGGVDVEVRGGLLGRLLLLVVWTLFCMRLFTYLSCSMGFWHRMCLRFNNVLQGPVEVAAFLVVVEDRCRERNMLRARVLRHT